MASARHEAPRSCRFAWVQSIQPATTTVRGYSWPVPKDLKPIGGKETFTIRVADDTKELYGKIESSRTIAIAAP